MPLELATIIAATALATSTYSSYKAGKAAEKSAGVEIASGYQQIEHVKAAAEIEAIADVESAVALRDKTTLDFQTIDRREQEVLSAVSANEKSYVDNTDLLEKQASILLIQRDREAAKDVSTVRARAAGAGVHASGGATAEVARDASISSALEKSRVKLQVYEAQQKLDEDIAKSRSDAFIAAQNIAADRESLGFSYDVAIRDHDLSIIIRNIERDAKINALESGAQVIRVSQTSAELGAFSTAMKGLSRMNPP
jgi:hypothetical protein